MDIVSILMIQSLPMALLCLLSFGQRLGASRQRLAAMTAALFVMNALLELSKSQLVPSGSIWRILFSLGTQLALAGVATCFVRRPFSMHLFLILLIKSYTDNLRMAGGAFSAFFFPSFSDTTVAFGLLCVTLPLLLLPMRRHVAVILELSPDQSFWRHICLIPLGLFLLVRVAVSPDYLWAGRVVPHAVLAASICWPIATFFSYFSVLRTYSTVARNHFMQRQVRDTTLVASVQAQQEQQAQQRAAKLRQDHGHMHEQLDGLQTLLRHGDRQGAQRLLGDWVGWLDGLPTRRLCANFPVDCFVRQAMQTASASGVELTAQLTLPATLPVPEPEFFVVLGNLLENAQEACDRQASGPRFIRLNAGIAGPTSIMISVFNSCLQPPVLCDGVYRSAKRSDGPGLGMASVRAIAAKHGGVAHFHHRDGVFEASVLLNGREAQEVQP